MIDPVLFRILKTIQYFQVQFIPQPKLVNAMLYQWPLCRHYHLGISDHTALSQNEKYVDLETSTSSEAEEMLDNDSHIGEERLGWYVNISVVTKFHSVYKSETFLYRSGAHVVIANQCQQQESAFAAKKSTKSKCCWLAIQL